MGSVKDLVIIEEPSKGKMGRGVFNFSDRYSVFDYGDTGQPIAGKGQALCAMTTHSFKRIEEELGYKTHFISRPEPNKMEVHLVRKMWDGEEPTNTDETTNFLIPLEIIGRFRVGETSSLMRRINSGKATWQSFGYDNAPDLNKPLEEPIIDFSTKFEPVDRYFDAPTEEERFEAVQNYARLGSNEFWDMVEKVTNVFKMHRRTAKLVGFDYIDGKTECAFDPNGDLMIVDATGTFDEDQYVKKIKFSKSFLRDPYRKTDWYETFMQVRKELLKEMWPTIPRLPQELIDAASMIYQSGCNALTETNEFPDAPSLDEVIELVQRVTKNN